MRVERGKKMSEFGKLNYQELGMSAMLLIENLMETLVQKDVISNPEFAEILDRTLRDINKGSEEQKVTAERLYDRWKGFRYLH
jgi:hypothetical protein